jgi:hypothetical protein
VKGRRYGHCVNQTFFADTFSDAIACTFKHFPVSQCDGFGKVRKQLRMTRGDGFV